MTIPSLDGPFRAQLWISSICLIYLLCYKEWLIMTKKKEEKEA